MAVRAVEPPTRLFPPEFEGQQVTVPSGASVFALVRRSFKSGKLPLICLHGFPQNSAMWAMLVREGLPSSFDERTLIIPDLPGYGQSTKPTSSDGSHYAHSKRAMALDVLDAADAILGVKNAEVVLIGHDRGARVASRAALDHSERVRALSVADIVPGSVQVSRGSFARADARSGRRCSSLAWSRVADLTGPMPRLAIERA